MFCSYAAAGRVGSLPYTSEDEGDHFLMLKNPLKFVADMQAFMAE